MKSIPYSRWILGALLYTMLVIVWGAWVRISHSGDGCGASWPLCQGQLIPNLDNKKTWVELTHRVMSGLYGIVVVALAWFAHRPPRVSEASRKWLRWTVFFMITEALLGAKLVLFGLVGQNDTPFRAFAMALHFVNSLFLTGSLTLAWLFSRAEAWKVRDISTIKGVSRRLLKRAPTGIVVLFLLIGLTGTVAALSNTLYPADHLIAGLLADLDGDSHYLVRLRGLHPTLGFLIGTGLTILLFLISESFGEQQGELRNSAFRLSLGFAVTVIIGSITLLTLAPLPLKLIHLLAAHSLWILTLTFWHQLRFQVASTTGKKKR